MFECPNPDPAQCASYVGDLLWCNLFVTHPGTVYVEVLEPISIKGWKVKDLDKHIAEVRERCDDVLRAGPVKA